MTLVAYAGTMIVQSFPHPTSTSLHYRSWTEYDRDRMNNYKL